MATRFERLSETATDDVLRAVVAGDRASEVEVDDEPQAVEVYFYRTSRSVAIEPCVPRGCDPSVTYSDPAQLRELAAVLTEAADLIEGPR